MKVWKYRLREPEPKFDNNWENGHIEADSFLEALKKLQDYKKATYADMKLEIAGLELVFEVDIT